MSKTQIWGIQEPSTLGLNYLSVEVSWGSRWVNLNDHDKFIINAESTRETTSKSWRKVTADSPVLGGNYLIHAVPDMVTESIGLWVYGQDQTDLNDNLWFAIDLFEQFDFRIRWTTNEYREYWRCQLAEASMARGQVWTHNQMAQLSFSVPRYPEVARERVG